MAFRRIKLASGVTTFSAHILRHVWATRFKADLLELMRQGGWKDFKQVERYRKSQPVKREDLFNPMDVRGGGLKPATITSIRRRGAA